jgi:hypothetical protein
MLSLRQPALRAYPQTFFFNAAPNICPLGLEHRQIKSVQRAGEGYCRCVGGQVAALSMV